MRKICYIIMCWLLLVMSIPCCDVDAVHYIRKEAPCVERIEKAHSNKMYTEAQEQDARGMCTCSVRINLCALALWALLPFFIVALQCGQCLWLNHWLILPREKFRPQAARRYIDTTSHSVFACLHINYCKFREDDYNERKRMVQGTDYWNGEKNR